MAKHQATVKGEVIQGDDPLHPNVEQRAAALKLALERWGWTAAISEERRGRFVKFSANVRSVGTEYDLEVYIFPNLASTGRARPNEKRIQLTRDYSEHRTDFELDKTGTRRCLLLGLYRLSDEEVVFCAWDAAAYREHSTPNSCYVDIHAIADAFRLGFARSRDTKGRYVCCFRPEFLYYYIENMNQLHDEPQNVPAENIESKFATRAPQEANVTGGENVIYYGAPGTGKSHKVDALVSDKLCVRTVFHPDTQNSDFVGALKPQMVDDRITYSFQPGPFAIALRNALCHPDEQTFLVIEELNRAPAAAVFGDLFLLLDRNEDGTGKYDVDFPNPEFRAWLSECVEVDIERMFLPANLWLLATMNSADQGVYPIDTAFRRRWRQVYVPINFTTAPAGAVAVVLPDGDSIKVEWRDFALAINEHLTRELSIAEDRLLGPWFVTADELTSSNTVPSKVLIYLWDDLLRHHGRDSVFDLQVVKTFGEVSQRCINGQHIFSKRFLSQFMMETSLDND